MPTGKYTINLPLKIPTVVQLPNPATKNDIGKIYHIQNETINSYFFGVNAGIDIPGWIELVPEVAPPMETPDPNSGTNRILFAGGQIGTKPTKTISYINLLLRSDAKEFADLMAPKHGLCSTSNGVLDRAIFSGGYVSQKIESTIEYMNISTPGTTSAFGDMTVKRTSFAATSNRMGNRGVFAGGNPSRRTNCIDYVTINTTGDGKDFGDLPDAIHSLAATSNGTSDRALFAGGCGAGQESINVITWVTISTLGNANDFGDLTRTRIGLTAVSNGAGNKGVIISGAVLSVMDRQNKTIQGTAPLDATRPLNIETMDYVSINVPSNALRFGKIVTTRRNFAGASNGGGGKAAFGGGIGRPAKSNSELTLNTIEYFTILTKGDSYDFGNLTSQLSWLTAVANGTAI